jgi:hypothetical protein
MGFERPDPNHVVLHVRIRRGQEKGTDKIDRGDKRKADAGQGGILEVMIG